MSPQRSRKPQERTAVTRRLLLAAAEEVFARVGYERAQVDGIADAAGFSKGALYAHFKSKEDLFLALYTDKQAAAIAKLRSALNAAPTHADKVAAFRSFYVDLSRDKQWAIIGLEVKLFVRRYPEVRERLQAIDDHAGDSIGRALTQLLGSSVRSAGEALGGIFSALVLESELEPEALPERRMRAMLGTIFDALLKLPSPSVTSAKTSRAAGAPTAARSPGQSSSDRITSSPPSRKRSPRVRGS